MKNVGTIIGEARSHLDDAHHWALTSERTPVVAAQPGGVDMEWDARDEAKKRLRAARVLIDRALAELGGAR